VLKLASNLSIPLEGVTESLGFLGRKGSGKSYRQRAPSAPLSC
jgi:hypothetical protein